MKNTELNFLKTNFLFNQDITNELNTSFGQDIIKKMIPHREPFLMVDNVELINIECRLIKAIRRVDEKDPVFGGHFPMTLYIQVYCNKKVCFKPRLF